MLCNACGTDWYGRGHQCRVLGYVSRDQVEDMPALESPPPVENKTGLEYLEKPFDKKSRNREIRIVKSVKEDFEEKLGGRIS